MCTCVCISVCMCVSVRVCVCTVYRPTYLNVWKQMRIGLLNRLSISGDYRAKRIHMQ